MLDGEIQPGVSKNFGLASLRLVSCFFRLSRDAEKSRHDCGKLGERFDAVDIVRCAKRAGFLTRITASKWRWLRRNVIPAIGDLTGADGLTGLVIFARVADGKMQDLTPALVGGGRETTQGHVVDQARGLGHGGLLASVRLGRQVFFRPRVAKFYDQLSRWLGNNAPQRSSLILIRACVVSAKAPLALTCVLLAGLTLKGAHAMNANSEDHGVEMHGTAPKIDRVKEIDLSSVGRGSWVKKLTFSPDGRYLAIVDDPNISTSTIIIWNLESDREQTRITGLPPFGDWPQIELLWSPDGKAITYGSGKPIKFWDPLTGAVIKELAVDGPDSWSRYNKDGTKFLVNRTPLAGHGGFRIYETGDWTYRDYGDDGLFISTMCWTADNMVMVAGAWARADEGRAIDDKKPMLFDVIIRLIDPTGKVPPRSVLVPAIPPDAPGHWPRQAMGLLESSVNFAMNKIITENYIVDGRSLEIFQYANDEDIRTGKIPATLEPQFSPDGKYIYLLGSNMDGTAKSLVVEAISGKPLTTFPGGHGGIAVSADGRKLAVGNGRAVDLYVVK